jgi:hypothetical protein
MEGIDSGERIDLAIPCLLCQEFKVERAISFPKTPLANTLPDVNRKQNVEEEFYPLDLGICGSCGHIQLTHIVPPNTLFKDYPYLSNSNSQTSNRFNTLAIEINKFALPNRTNFAIEIGSNDGYFLKCLQDLGWKVLGIDPAEKASKIATDIGVANLCAFFSEDLATSILSRHGVPDVIIANNVLAHSDDMNGIFTGISKLIGQNSVLVIEFSYAVDIFQKLLFDTIYHEHMSYHKIESLQIFLRKFDLFIHDAIRFDAHGGSLRLYIRRAQPACISERLESLLYTEKLLRLDLVSSWADFESRIAKLKVEIELFIKDIRSQDFKIVGYGIPAKFSTLFYTLELKFSDFDYFVDDNQLKVGRSVPGTKAVILEIEELNDNPPDYIFLFSWNYSESIVRKIKENGLCKKGIIIPLPDFRVIEI